MPAFGRACWVRIRRRQCWRVGSCGSAYGAAWKSIGTRPSRRRGRMRPLWICGWAGMRSCTVAFSTRRWGVAATGDRRSRHISLLPHQLHYQIGPRLPRLKTICNALIFFGIETTRCTVIAPVQVLEVSPLLVGPSCQHHMRGLEDLRSSQSNRAQPIDKFGGQRYLVPEEIPSGASEFKPNHCVGISCTRLDPLWPQSVHQQNGSRNRNTDSSPISQS